MRVTCTTWALRRERRRTPRVRKVEMLTSRQTGKWGSKDEEHAGVFTPDRLKRQIYFVLRYRNVYVTTFHIISNSLNLLTFCDWPYRQMDWQLCLETTREAWMYYITKIFNRSRWRHDFTFEASAKCCIFSRASQTWCLKIYICNRERNPTLTLQFIEKHCQRVDRTLHKLGYHGTLH